MGHTLELPPKPIIHPFEKGISIALIFPYFLPFAAVS
jgi:hypothetical protein